MKKNRKVFHIRRQDRVCHGGGTGRIITGDVSGRLGYGRERGNACAGYAKWVCRATESDAEGDLQDFDEENLDEVELEADLITDFDKNMEADQGGYAGLQIPTPMKSWMT